MTSQLPSYRGYRFPAEIISHAVWLYHRFCLSFRDVEDLLAQRGITVSYETVMPLVSDIRPRLRTDVTGADETSWATPGIGRPGTWVDASSRSRRRSVESYHARW